jgi:zinc protease
MESMLIRAVWVCMLVAVVGIGGSRGVSMGQAGVKVPPLAYRDRYLGNGLRFLSLEDHSSPTVAVQVWYKVGGKDDPERRSGFAHLFEHIMFKGTRHMKPEMMDRLTEDVGGYNNAETGDDFTHYYEEIPSNYLQTLLWAEAERLSSLTVNEANFKSERDVVKEEFRQRILADPYGRFWQFLEQKSFVLHPYKRSTIGSIEDLDAASLEDVRAFHGTFYRPDNAVLVVAGDFDQKVLDEWVDRYFGGIPKPPGAIPRVATKEPPRNGEKRYTEYGQNVPLPAVAFTYLVPPVTDSDAPTLRVIQALLSEGESSRLYQTLVYTRQSAQQVFAIADLREDAGLLDVGAILASGRKPSDVLGELSKEIDRLRTESVGQAELDKARNQLVTNELRDRQTCTGKADLLGEATLLYGDPARANSEIDRLQRVSASDIQRVAASYFAASNRVAIEYLPESMRNQAVPADSPGGRTR